MVWWKRNAEDINRLSKILGRVPGWMGFIFNRWINYEMEGMIRTTCRGVWRARVYLVWMGSRSTSQYPYTLAFQFRCLERCLSWKSIGTRLIVWLKSLLAILYWHLLFCNLVCVITELPTRCVVHSKCASVGNFMTAWQSVVVYQNFAETFSSFSER